MLNTKSVEIGKDKKISVNIIQFSPFEALNLRKELVAIAKKELNDIDESSVGIIKAIASLVYEIPPEFLLKLFKNCSAMEIGGLGDKSNFEKAFEGNLDGTTELAMEVLEFNGFFTLSIISVLAKKIPALAPMETAILKTLEDLKAKKS